MICTAHEISVKFRKMRWAGHVALMAESRGAYRFLVKKSEGQDAIWKTQA